MKKLVFLILFIAPFISYSQSKFCGDISVHNDDLRGSLSYSSPIGEPVLFTRVKDKEGDNVYLRMSASGAILTYSGKGVVVLFDDGTKWERENEKLDVDVDPQSNYRYSCFIELTMDDIILFSNKKIIKYGLYIFDRQVKDKKAEKYMEYAKCLKKTMENKQ